jgi:hypothetical protein
MPEVHPENEHFEKVFNMKCAWFSNFDHERGTRACYIYQGWTTVLL